MKQTIIHDLMKFQVTSHGNGLAYELTNKFTDKSVFLQGDDAECFRDTLDGLTESRRGPQLNYSDALACIWSDYAENSDDWGIR